MFLSVSYWENPVDARKAIEAGEHWTHGDSKVLHTSIYIPNILHYHKVSDHCRIETPNGAMVDVIRILLVGEVSIYTTTTEKEITSQICNSLTTYRR